MQRFKRVLHKVRHTEDSIGLINNTLQYSISNQLKEKNLKISWTMCLIQGTRIFTERLLVISLLWLNLKMSDLWLYHTNKLGVGLWNFELKIEESLIDYQVYILLLVFLNITWRLL